jgi:hypothetical protein
LQVTELEGEFEKVSGGRVVPTRYIRSQQQKQQVEVAAEEEGQEAEGEEEVDAPPPLDPLELIDPVDIVAKLPKDFYEKLEAKKWQERKEALDELEKLIVQNPKLEGNDYGDLVRTLKKVLFVHYLLPTLRLNFAADRAEGLERGDRGAGGQVHGGRGARPPQKVPAVRVGVRRLRAREVQGEEAERGERHARGHRRHHPNS